jgi:hypothetical protein
MDTYSMFDSRCSETLEFYTIRKTKSCERPKKNFWPNFFSFCYNFCLRRRILLKFWMSHLGVVFHIWYKMLDLFWSVRGLTSKLPTYPTCQLAPLSPTAAFIFSAFELSSRLDFWMDSKSDILCSETFGINWINRVLQWHRCYSSLLLVFNITLSLVMD